jgi:signal transduction histidine kinase
MLDELGVVEAVQSLVTEARNHIPSVAYLPPDSLPRFASDVEATIFRIVQESLANITKHAQASHASVVLERQGEGEVRVIVSDDGVGFDLAAVPEDRFGLESIRQRCRLFHQEALISSSPDKGCRIEVVLPLFPSLRPVA